MPTQEEVASYYATLFAETGPCEEWAKSKDGGGYGEAWHNGRHWKAHRLAWEQANFRHVSPGMVIRHRCDNPPCVNPRHLLIGTPADNTQDAIERCRVSAQLDSTKAKEIRNKYARGGITQTQLAEEYGVCHSVISDTVQGKLWKQAGGGIFHRQRLTEAQVVKIRERFAAGGVRKAALAREYGVDDTAIGQLIRGKTWPHAGGPITR